jgi:acetate kinase
MKILVINCGSSSIKYKLFDMSSRTVLAQGGIEKVGIPGSFLKYTKSNGEKAILEKDVPDHSVGIQWIFDMLTDPKEGCIKSLSELDAVGHRVLHGGDKFTESCLVTDSVKEQIKACFPLGPLHNPANLKGIMAVETLLPNIPQVAVFDTAFHQTMPRESFLYAVPYELYEKDAVRRYGFHGTSHRFVSKRALEYLGMKAEGSKIITAHIGNGGSITAVVDGKSFDTSMGMTPLEGLMMGTRSGDIDTGAVTYLMEREGYNAKKISDILNKQSGLLGISGVSSDMREVEAAADGGNERAKLAINMFVYRVRKYIGAYIAAMNGIDAIVFTGGIGENNQPIREAVCLGLSGLGVDLDLEQNKKIRGVEGTISTPSSKIKVIVIPTDEEYMIASDTLDLVKK